MDNADLVQFGPRPLVNSNPTKLRFEFLEIEPELAKVRIGLRSALSKARIELASGKHVREIDTRLYPTFI